MNLKYIRLLEEENNVHLEALLSVVVITYNHVSFIGDAINSILDQRVNFKTEIIIHDDCSNDGTTDILLNFKRLYPNTIKIILQEENLYQKGIRHITTHVITKYSTGKYVSICEGDDYFNDDLKLFKQVLFLEKNLDFVASVHNHLKEDLYTNKIHKIITQFRGELLLKNAIVMGNHIATNSFVFRKNLIDELPNYYYSAPMGDYPLIIHFTMQGRVKHFFRFMSTYRYGVRNSFTTIINNSTTQDKINYYKENLKWYEMLESQVPKAYVNRVRFLEEELDENIKNLKLDSDKNKKDNFFTSLRLIFSKVTYRLPFPFKSSYAYRKFKLRLKKVFK